MRAPSVEALTIAFPHLAPESITRIRQEMKGVGESPAGSRIREALEAIDTILGTYGVESIPAGHNSKSPAIDFCNTGETYDVTVMYLSGGRCGRGAWAIGCWGDIVERGDYD